MKKFETAFRSCSFLNQEGLRGLVGWGQWEPCFAYVTELAILFDFSLLNAVPQKTIDRAILQFDEAGPSGPIPSFQYPGWTNADGKMQFKPNGCVVVRVPAADWATGQVPRGPLATQNHGATLRRIGARTWDVTQPIRWQIDPSTIPLVPPGRPFDGRGFGLVLGGQKIEQLTAQDSTNCISRVWNTTIEVTYTVPPREGSARPPR